MKPKALSLLILCLTVSGCQSTLYHWGNYENVIYLSYNAPDKATAEKQIHILEEDLEKARSADKALPPGFLAHLGVLYLQTGQTDKALNAFEGEKLKFPESTKLMDRFIEKM